MEALTQQPGARLITARRLVVKIGSALLVDQASGDIRRAWLDALESLRLVLGTQLDVTEEIYARDLDPADPLAPALALYGYLSWLQEQLIDVVSRAQVEERD